MANKKSDKNTTLKKKKKTAPSRRNSFFSIWNWFKENVSDQNDISNEHDMTRQENIRFIVGAILSIVSAFILLALVSYLFTGAEDQKLFTDQGFEQYTAANWMGVWGAKLAHYMIENWFGVPSILIPIFLLATSIRVMRIYKVRLHKWFLNCMILMIWLSVFAAFVVQPLFNKSFINFGGQIGLTEVSLIRQRIGTPGVLAILFITAVMYLAYLSDEAISILRKALTSKATQSEDDDDSTELDESKIPPEQLISEEDFEVTAATPEAPFEDKAADTATTIEFSDTEPQPEHILKPFEQELPLDIEVSKPEEKMEIIVGKNPEEANLVDTRALEPYDPKLDLENYKYPTLDLLKKYDISDSGIDMDEQQQNKNRILKVLSNFGVDISSIKATIGPTITLYEITPAPGVRISKIRNLEDDIALSLSALGIRIIAPIPGKGTIGIEVPNAKPQVVSMESVINSRKFQETDYELPMALGKTITNEVFMVDLVKMPHLLVAGATGQGKSVGLNAIITSLLYKKHPAELKLVMVDPKKVEFSVYNPIVNHFLAQVEGNEDTEEPIITDVNKVIQTLKSLCVEMEDINSCPTSLSSSMSSET